MPRALSKVMVPNNQSRMVAMLKRAGPPAFGIIFMGFFIYFALAGPNGVLAYREYDRQLEARQKEYAELDRKRSDLRNRVEQLDPRRANPDMVDELVRKELNVVHPDEVIIPIQ